MSDPPDDPPDATHPSIEHDDVDALNAAYERLRAIAERERAKAANEQKSDEPAQ